MAGEKFLLTLYGARRVDALDKYRYTCYNRSIAKSSLTSSFIGIITTPNQCSSKTALIQNAPDSSTVAREPVESNRMGLAKSRHVGPSRHR